MAIAMIVIGKSSEIENFWQLLGPLFCDRKVIKELGDYIFDNNLITWFVIRAFKNRVQGFCCMEWTSTKIKLRHEYVLPGSRGLGYYSMLYNARRDYINNNFRDMRQEIITKNEVVLQKVLSDGFLRSGNKGEYSVCVNQIGDF